MWRACWNDILYLAMMVHQNHKSSFGNGRMHWRGKQWWLKNAVRAGANSFQLFLIEIFLFKSNHTGKLIPLQNSRTYRTEHEKKQVLSILAQWHIHQTNGKCICSVGWVTGWVQGQQSWEWKEGSVVIRERWQFHSHSEQTHFNKVQQIVWSTFHRLVFPMILWVMKEVWHIPCSQNDYSLLGGWHMENLTWEIG